MICKHCGQELPDDKNAKPYKLPVDPLNKVVMGYKLILGIKEDNRVWDKGNWGRAKKTAKDLIEIFNGDWEKTVNYMEVFAEDYKKKGLSFTIETMFNNYDVWKLEKEAVKWKN